MNMIKETWVLFLHHMRANVRFPAWVLVALFQPLCYLFLYAPLLKKLAGQPGFGTVDPINIFVPGLLIMLAFYGTVFVGYSIISDLRDGVIERLRVTPASRFALLLGRVLWSGFVLLVQGIILIICSIPLGLTISISGVLLSLGLIVLLGICIASLSYSLALSVKEEDMFGAFINFFTNPMLLLSGVLLPLTLAPAWLLTISSFNPLKHVVDASRALFNTGVFNYDVLVGFVVIIVMVTISLWIGVKVFRKAVS
jgi:ABC-2 type transport system permease protein